METQIYRHVKILNSLSVNTALWILRRSFDNYFHSVFRMPLEPIDKWVIASNDKNIQQYWSKQRQMKRPHLFLYGMYLKLKNETIGKREYARENSTGISIPSSKKDYGKQDKIVKQISKEVKRLSFSEGFRFLGKLAGTWMLTCPEAIIRSEKNVEKVGEWQVRKETLDWKAPEIWRSGIYQETRREEMSEVELQLLFTLDFLHHITFDDYDASNIV